MKRVFFLFLISFLSQIYAQNIKLVYDFIPNRNETYRETVYCNKDGLKISVRDPLNMHKVSNKIADDDAMSSTFDINLKEAPKARKITVVKSKDYPILETEYLKNIQYQVEDMFPKIKWNTNYTETEKIGNYVCNKATANYRGTTLIAYYTNEIPFPIGPYKFGGLSGAIVMLYNESLAPNYWILTEVEYPYIGSLNDNYSQKLNDLPKITLKKLIEEQDKEDDEKLKIFRSKTPQGVKVETVASYRNTVEQVYEWEQNTKK